MYTTDATSIYFNMMTQIGSAWLENVTDTLKLTSRLCSFTPLLSAPPLPPSPVKAAEPSPETYPLNEDFIAVVTHEFRTPLTSICAASEILHDNPNLDQQRREQLVQVILQESHRLTHVVNQALDLAEIGGGQAEWRLSEVDFKAVIEEAVVVIGPMAQERHIQLRVYLPLAVPPVLADKERFKQVMLNLLSHALKFCEAEAGEVRVSLQADESVLQVEVSHNGADLNPVAPQFHPAAEISPIQPAWAEDPQITNVNLLICCHIIAHFGGRFWAQNNLNGGTRFLFTLPLQPA